MVLRKGVPFFAVLLLAVSGWAGEGAPKRVAFRLEEIGHLAPKGRAQDREYNPNSRVVDQIVAYGKGSIPLLIAELENEKEIGEVMDYWGPVRAGDVAFVLLVNLFTEPSGRASTVPGYGFDEIVGGDSRRASAQERYQEFLKKNGRVGMKRKWSRLWERQKESIYWDSVQRCFRIRGSDLPSESKGDRR